MLTTDSILKELSVMSEMSTDIVDFLEDANSFLNSLSLNEAEYDKVTDKLRLEILDVDRFIKVNECKVVTNPRAFIRDGIPSDDGLLSITIFGNTMEEKMGKFGYIDLHGNFMNPSLYKAWTRLDKRIRNIVHGIGFYRIDDRGQIVEDEKGKTGIYIDPNSFNSNQQAVKTMYKIMPRLVFEDNQLTVYFNSTMTKESFNELKNIFDYLYQNNLEFNIINSKTTFKSDIATNSE